jgi:hypothetical protein
VRRQDRRRRPAPTATRSSPQPERCADHQKVGVAGANPVLVQLPEPVDLSSDPSRRGTGAEHPARDRPQRLATLDDMRAGPLGERRRGTVWRSACLNGDSRLARSGSRQRRDGGWALRRNPDHRRRGLGWNPLGGRRRRCRALSCSASLASSVGVILRVRLGLRRCDWSTRRGGRLGARRGSLDDGRLRDGRRGRNGRRGRDGRCLGGRDRGLGFRRRRLRLRFGWRQELGIGIVDGLALHRGTVSGVFASAAGVRRRSDFERQWRLAAGIEVGRIYIAAAGLLRRAADRLLGWGRRRLGCRHALLLLVGLGGSRHCSRSGGREREKAACKRGLHTSRDQGPR